MTKQPDIDLSLEGQVSRSVAEYGDRTRPSSLKVAMSFYRAYGEFHRAHLQELSSFGLSVSHFNVLTVLHRANEPLAMNEIGRALAVQAPNLTGVVDKLERMSYVVRLDNKRDRRSTAIGITAQGEAFIDAFFADHCAYLDAIQSGLDEKEREQLASLLERLHRSVASATAERQARKRETTELAEWLAEGAGSRVARAVSSPAR